MRIRLAAALALTLALAAGCARPAEAPAAPDPLGPSPTPRTVPPGDGAPHNAENNAWKVRTELTDAEKAEAQAAADKIKPALEAVRAGNDFGYTATRSALLALGYAADRIQVQSMRDPTVAGAVYAVRIGTRACVIGDVRPERVTAEVRGSAAEFGCLEPYTH
ncbi:hypothetical protein [Dactylosporangium sp. CA-139066]|uniref:hypothetical protein n=1 Tax=Dactylosporangium sp. CA-139066 TaxID=3239930 RepID=UPI003D8A8879